MVQLSNVIWKAVYFFKGISVWLKIIHMCISCYSDINMSEELTKVGTVLYYQVFVHLVLSTALLSTTRNRC